MTLTAGMVPCFAHPHVQRILQQVRQQEAGRDQHHGQHDQQLQAAQRAGLRSGHACGAAAASTAGVIDTACFVVERVLEMRTSTWYARGVTGCVRAWQRGRVSGVVS